MDGCNIFGRIIGITNGLKIYDTKAIVKESEKIKRLLFKPPTQEGEDDDLGEVVEKAVKDDTSESTSANKKQKQSIVKVEKISPS